MKVLKLISGFFGIVIILIGGLSSVISLLDMMYLLLFKETERIQYAGGAFIVAIISMGVGAFIYSLSVDVIETTESNPE